MVVLPPGTLLQLMYIRARLKPLPAGRFIEIGAGSGEITRLLLDLGWSGCVYDLDQTTISKLRQRFSVAVDNAQLITINADYLQSPPPPPFDNADLVISCMVLEHLEEQQVLAFMSCSSNYLKADGLMVGLVPGSPSDWGVEDEIAGHLRRYTSSSIEDLINKTDWQLLHQAGLTFPISNLLLPLSNFLVKRAEQSKLSQTALQRTKLSGRRKVLFKTHFPQFVGFFLNEITLKPFYYLQILFSHSKRSLVLYFEARPK